MSWVAGWISAGLVTLSTSWAVAAPQPSSRTQHPVAPRHSDAALRHAVTVMLRDTTGQQLGSGVLVASALGGRWVVSNRHVVAGYTALCVVTADRAAGAALVVGKQLQEQRGLDLALIWLPSSGQSMALVAEVSQQPMNADALPLVLATGFPTPLHNPIDGLIYTERAGLLVPLLKAPLEDGMDLAYTALVEKGMSGGGVFLGTQLIGINSAHRDPLWPGHWRDTQGRVVDETLNQKLDLVSLGISAKSIHHLLQNSTMPSSDQLNQLIGIECKQQVDSGISPNPADKRKQTW